jgi:hypothetical protein
MNVLLVEPNFPIPSKSKNHKSFLPIGLLKLASYYRNKGHMIKLVKGNAKLRKFEPNQIMITSLFTYWSRYVKECVQFYKQQFPKSKIIVGGIYASLMPDHCKEFTGCDEVFAGVHKEAEKFLPSYDLVDVDYQIVHTSRGCVRRCAFCGTWKIEPKFEFKESIKDKIKSNKLIFYDNNLLANPYAKNILFELANARYNGKVVISECQCGFDGRLLTPEIAKLIKKARFQNVRIAWDGKYSQWKEIKKQIEMLIEVGYKSKDLYVFMIYNWDVSYKEMFKKLKKCKQWKVQIADCRYRPLNQTFDNYNSHAKEQTNEEYFIHPKWKDWQVRKFRKIVREQNICIRMGFKKYSKELEHKGAIKRKIEPQRYFKENPEKLLRNTELKLELV